MCKLAKKLGLLLFVSALYSGNVMADRCTDWQQSSTDPVALKVCEYSSGGSGKAEIRNTGYNNARVCYELDFYESSSYNGCHTLSPGSSTTVSCFSCAERNGGMKSWSVESYESR